VYTYGDGFDLTMSSTHAIPMIKVFNKFDKLSNQQQQGDNRHLLANRFDRIIDKLDKEERHLRDKEALLEMSGFIIDHGCLVSCHSGYGVNNLLQVIETVVKKLVSSSSSTSSSDEPYIITRERHRRHAQGCLDALDAYLAAVGYYHGSGGGESFGKVSVEVAAEELRIAARELGRVVGNIDVEEVLDVLFRDFCIGK
jgi:tRNA U34 5-carboxymethylaminomethyl modifying GTPase MnmE/TrmE